MSEKLKESEIFENISPMFKAILSNKHFHSDGNVLYLSCPIWKPLTTCGC